MKCSVVFAVAVGWLTVLADVTVADEPAARELKIFAKVATESDDSADVGPIHFGQVREQLVFRGPQELVEHSRRFREAEDRDAQRSVEAELAEFLKVGGIDWEEQMVVAVSAGRDSSTKDLQFAPLQVSGDVLVVSFSPRRIRGFKRVTPKAVLLVERFDGEVRFDPAR